MNRVPLVALLLLATACGNVVSGLRGVGGSGQAARSEESRFFPLPYDGDYAFTVEPLNKVITRAREGEEAAAAGDP